MVFQQMCLGVQVFLIVFLSVCLSAGQLLGLSDSLSMCRTICQSLSTSIFCLKRANEGKTRTRANKYSPGYCSRPQKDSLFGVGTLMKSHEIPSGVKYILTVKNKMKKCLKRVATYDAYSYLSLTKHCIFRKDAHLIKDQSANHEYSCLSYFKNCRSFTFFYIRLTPSVQVKYQPYYYFYCKCSLQ